MISSCLGTEQNWHPIVNAGALLELVASDLHLDPCAMQQKLEEKHLQFQADAFDVRV